MNLYLFDTDMLTLFSEGHPRVCERASSHPAESLITSIVTVEEQLSGVVHGPSPSQERSAIGLRL